MTIAQYTSFTAHKKDDITYYERKKLLEYLMHLKEKRDGKSTGVHRWPATKAIHDKIRGKLSNSVA